MDLTLKEFIKTNKREVSFLAISATLLLLASLFFLASGERGSVPEDFEDARLRAIGLSEQIVDRANQSREALIDIATKDGLGDYNGALFLVQNELSQIESIHFAALELHAELTTMSDNLRDITPVRAREVGTAATLRGINLVEGLIAYNNSMKDLLNALERKLRGIDVGGDIGELVEQTNSNIREINSANADYQALIKEFKSLAGIS